MKKTFRNCFENIYFWKQDTLLVRKKLLPFPAVLQFLFEDLSTCFYWFQFLFSWSQFLKNRDNVSFFSLKGTTSYNKIEYSENFKDDLGENIKQKQRGNSKRRNNLFQQYAPIVDLLKNYVYGKMIFIPRWFKIFWEPNRYRKLRL